MPAKRKRYDNGQQCQLVLTNTADDGDADDNNSMAENDFKAESDDGNNNNRRGLSLC